VLIRAVVAGGATHPVDGAAAIRLPPHPGRLQIDYTALSLTMPERMRFLYLLEGVDDGWQDGGTSRSAVYTDLGPGDYLFRVRASNNDGVWSMGDAVLRFHVAPAMVQTTWFRLLCAALCLLALWGLYALRMAQVARQLRQQLEARIKERERIARELHDTFLQTLQALILKLHVALQRLPAGEPARADMQRSLALAEIALEEGRDRVQGLRLASGRQPELSRAVADAVRADYDGAAPPLLRATGLARRLRPQVFDETLALAREALINARRHAHASRIALDVVYGDDALVVTVSDDGCGIADAIQQAGHLDGHFGMICMRERAQRIGADLSLDSAAGKGTCWTVVLAAGLAYEDD
jgi:signal transduction histidine kinase